MQTFLGILTKQLTDYNDSNLVFFLSLTGVVMRRKRREVKKHQRTKSNVNMRHRGKIPNWPIWR